MAEFKNPNQPGGQQDNRTLYAIMFAMLLALTAFNYYRAKHNPQTASPNAPGVAQSQASQIPQPTPTITETIEGHQVQIPAVQPVVAANESTTTVENELYKITFSNKGAQATSWILKKYKDSYGKPLDLVHSEAAATVGYPLSLYTYDPSLTANLANVLYLPSATGALTAPATLTFRYVSGEYSVTKTFSFDDSYVLHADTVVLRNGAPISALLAWPGGFGDQENALSYSGAQLDFSQAGREKHEGFKDVHQGNTLTGGFDWAGTSDLYFASIILPDAPSSTDSARASPSSRTAIPKKTRSRSR